MAFGSFSCDSHAPMAEINTTPLVDVMLVLLVEARRDIRAAVCAIK